MRSTLQRFPTLEHPTKGRAGRRKAQGQICQKGDALTTPSPENSMGSNLPGGLALPLLLCALLSCTLANSSTAALSWPLLLDAPPWRCRSKVTRSCLGDPAGRARRSCGRACRCGALGVRAPALQLRAHGWRDVLLARRCKPATCKQQQKQRQQVLRREAMQLVEEHQHSSPLRQAMGK